MAYRPKGSLILVDKTSQILRAALQRLQLPLTHPHAQVPMNCEASAASVTGRLPPISRLVREVLLELVLVIAWLRLRCHARLVTPVALGHQPGRLPQPVLTCPQTAVARLLEGSKHGLWFCSDIDMPMLQVPSLA